MSTADRRTESFLRRLETGQEGRTPWRHAASGLAALLLTAALPAGAADPLLDMNFQVSNIAAVDGDRDAVRTAVAYNATDDEYLVVWEGDGLADPIPNPTMVDNDDRDEIFGRILDSLGNTVVADFRISSSSDAALGFDAADPAVAYDSLTNRFLVVWQGDTAAGGEIFGQVLSAAGADVGGQFQVSGASADDASSPDVAYNATDGEFLAAWQEGAGNLDQIYVRRVGGSGALPGAPFLLSTTAGTRSAANPALAYNGSADPLTGNSYLVVYEVNGLASDTGAGLVVGRTLAVDTATDGFTPSVREAIGAVRSSRPDVAFNSVDEGFLVVYQAETPARAQSRITGRRLLPDGLTDGAAFSISQGLLTHAPAVAYNRTSNQYLAVWQGAGNNLRHEIFGRLVRGDGTLLGSSEFAVSSVFADTGDGNRDGASPDVAAASPDPLFLVGFEADAVLPAVGTDDLSEIFAQFAQTFFVDLRLVKGDGGAVFRPGDTIAYSLTAHNDGTEDATGVVITETVPANTTFDPAASTAGWVCAPDTSAGSTCTLDVGAFTAGANSAATFSVTVDNPLGPSVTTISNTALVADDGANGADPMPANNTATEDTPRAPSPDLRLVKGDGDAAFRPGGTIVYGLTVHNDSTGDATGVVVTETVPANTTFDPAASTAGWVCSPDTSAGSTCTLDVGALAAGTNSAATFAVTVDDPLDRSVTAISNSASVADDGANGADPTPANNSATEGTPRAPLADLRIRKSDRGAKGVAGQDLTYRLRIDNIGADGVTGVVVTETVPDNTKFDASSSTTGWTCTNSGRSGATCSFPIGAMAPGAERKIKFAVTLKNPLPGGVTTISNTAVVAGDGGDANDANPANNSVTEQTRVIRVEQRLEALLAQFDAAVDKGTLVNSGESRRGLKIVRRHLKQSLKLFNRGRISGTCRELKRALVLSDGKSEPDDLVRGRARSSLARGIKRVRNLLGCES